MRFLYRGGGVRTHARHVQLWIGLQPYDGRLRSPQLHSRAVLYKRVCSVQSTQDLIDNVPASVVTYEDAFTYCALQCINDPGHGGCNQIWVSYEQLGPPASGPYWCLYGAGLNKQLRLALDKL